MENSDHHRDLVETTTNQPDKKDPQQHRRDHCDEEEEIIYQRQQVRHPLEIDQTTESLKEESHQSGVEEAAPKSRNSKKHQSISSSKVSNETNMTTEATNQHDGEQPNAARRTHRPSIVDRVNQLPIVNMAVEVSHSHYDKLKQSNVTVGDVMSKAEQWAYCMWGSVQPFITRFQEPLGKADQLACQTLDYVEEKVPSIKKSPAELTDEAKSMKVKYTQVVEQSMIAKFVKMIAESFLKTMHTMSSPATSQPTASQ